MKKILMLAVQAVMLWSVTGCRDFLNEQPLSSVSSETYYQNDTQANSTVLGMYDNLSNAYNGLTYIAMTDLSSDIGRVGTLPAPSPSNQELNSNGWTSQTGNLATYWSNFYGVINRANAIIERVPRIPRASIPEANQKQYIAEAKFVRALSYLNLTRAFGDVPLVLTETTSLGSENVFKARTPQAEVFAQIHKDLDEAAPDLPLRFTGANLGRATRGAVNAVNAEAYLFEKNYAKAREKALEVISSGVYSLLPNFRDVITVKNGSEHVFSIQYDYEIRANGIGAATNPQINPFTFFYDGMRGQGLMAATQYFMNTYPRTYRQQFTVADSMPIANTGVLTAIPSQAPVITRHVDLTVSLAYRGGTATIQGSTNTNANLNAYRYAGVLLTFAEADFELNGPTAQSLGYINQIRKRARTNDKNVEERVSLLPDLTLNQLTLDAILTERRNELAFEGHRRWDLLRRNQYAAQLALAGKTAGPEDVLFPIPFNQIQINPSLTQNPGY